nr:hypothetical protein CFP56_13285 [Quercus suber]
MPKSFSPARDLTARQPLVDIPEAFGQMNTHRALQPADGSFPQCRLAFQLCCEVDDDYLTPKVSLRIVGGPTPIMATVRAEGSRQTPTVEGLFAGLSFFLVQRIPRRSNIISLIQTNGGRVVRVEAQADHVLADHLRNDAPPGSISWIYVEHALRDGSLMDVASYAAGPLQGEVRSVGSVVPGKQTRTPFTAEEDRTLYIWVEAAARRGAMVKGNEVYKEFAALHPRHPYQSWRDRYINRLKDSPPEGLYPGGFTQDDLDALLGFAEDIENIDERQEEAWSAYAELYPKHTAVQWANFYDDQVRSIYLANRKKPPHPERSRKRKRRHETMAEKTAQSSIEKASSSVDSAVVRSREGSEDQIIDGRSTANVLSQPIDQSVHDYAGAPARPSTRRQSTPEAPNEHDTTCIPLQGKSEPHATNSATESKNLLVKLPMPSGPIDTSDNMDAERQFRLEIMSRDYSPRQHAMLDDEIIQPGPLNPVVPTSDLNRAANQRIGANSSGPVRNILTASDDGEPLAVRSQLTEANMQSHRHEHRIRYVRGVDIPEDMESRGQEEFVSYLSNFVKHDDSSEGTAEQRKDNTTSDDAHHSPQGEEETQTLVPGVTEEASTGTTIRTNVLPESDTGLFDENGPNRKSDFGVDLGDYTNSQILPYSDSDELEQSIPSVLPLSSQQEFDDTMESVIHWPELPETPKAHEQISSLNPPQGPITVRRGISPEPAPGDYVEVSVEGRHELPRSDEVAVDLTVVEPEGGFELTSPLKPASLHSPPNNVDRTMAAEASSVIESGRSMGHQSKVRDIAKISSPRLRGQHNECVADEGDEMNPNTAQFEDSVPDVQIYAGIRALETQDILDMETQVPDLEIPLPLDSDDESSMSPFPRRPTEKVAHNIKASLRQIGQDAMPNGTPLGSVDVEDDVDYPPGLTEGTTVIPPPAPTPPQRFESFSTQKREPRHLPNAVQLVEGDDVDEYIATLRIRHDFEVDGIIDALKCTSMRPELTEIVLFDERSGHGFPRDVPGIWSSKEDAEIESGVASRLRMAEEKHGWDEVMARLEFLRKWRE